MNSVAVKRRSSSPPRARRRHLESPPSHCAPCTCSGLWARAVRVGGGDRSAEVDPLQGQESAMPADTPPQSMAVRALSREALAFAPGLLAIQESPPAPLPQAVLYSVTLLTL